MYEFEYLARLDISHPSKTLQEFDGMFPWKIEDVSEGDLRYNKRGEPLNRRAFLSLISWRLHKGQTASSSESPLEDLLYGCIEVLKTKKEQIRSITESRGTVQIEIAVRPTHYGVFVLPAEIMAQIGALGVQIAICIVLPPGQLTGVASASATDRGEFDQPSS